nr:TRAP transporter small permease [Roseovarius pacificus]
MDHHPVQFGRSDVAPEKESIRKTRSIERLIIASDNIIGWIERIALFIACVAVVALMMLVALDASMRYLFNNPLGFTADAVVLYLLPASMFCAFSYTFRRGGHVAVDAIANTFPDRMVHFILGVLFLAAAYPVAEMALGGGRITWESWINGEITGGGHPTPVWLSKVLVPVGMGLLSLRLCHAAVANLWAGATSSDDLAYPARTKSGYTPETERAA